MQVEDRTTQQRTDKVPLRRPDIRRRVAAFQLGDLLPDLRCQLQPWSIRYQRPRRRLLPFLRGDFGGTSSRRSGGPVAIIFFFVVLVVSAIGSIGTRGCRRVIEQMEECGCQLIRVLGIVPIFGRRSICRSLNGPFQNPETIHKPPITFDKFDHLFNLGQTNATVITSINALPSNLTAFLGT